MKVPADFSAVLAWTVVLYIVDAYYHFEESNTTHLTSNLTVINVSIASVVYINDLGNQT